MADPFTRKTYLHAATDDVLPVRFSLFKRTRALQVQSFLKTLAAGADEAAPERPLELLVLTPADWKRLLSAPYGWGLARRDVRSVSLLVPAAYPPRLFARWDAVRLRAAQVGVTAPGGVQAWCDTQLGLEWAHALLLSWWGPGRVPKAWAREVSAAYLYQRTLRALRDEQRLAYLEVWARVQQAGARPRVELEAFVYPRAKMPLDNLLWTQSGCWLQATELGDARGWTLSAAAVRGVLEAQSQPALTHPEPL